MNLRMYLLKIEVVDLFYVCVWFIRSDDNGEDSPSFHPDLKARLSELGEALHGIILMHMNTIIYKRGIHIMSVGDRILLGWRSLFPLKETAEIYRGTICTYYHVNVLDLDSIHGRA